MDAQLWREFVRNQMLEAEGDEQKIANLQTILLGELVAQLMELNEKFDMMTPVRSKLTRLVPE